MSGDVRNRIHLVKFYSNTLITAVEYGKLSHFCDCVRYKNQPTVMYFLWYFNANQQHTFGGFQTTLQKKVSLMFSYIDD